MIRDAAGVPVLPLRAPGRAEALPDAPAPQPTPVVNPRLRIDPALNIVVIEFRDEAGQVGLSIPTPRELDAYRRNAAPAEPQPDGEREATAPPATVPPATAPPATAPPATGTDVTR